MSGVSRRTIVAAGARGALTAAGQSVRHPRRHADPTRAGGHTEPSTIDPAERRYLGCSAADLRRPYAKYMQSATRPAQEHAVAAYWGEPADPALIPSLDDLADDLNRAGDSPIENGYGLRSDGLLWVAVRTDMPRVSAAMWDWWFGWHSSESARYRLWHPDAHAYAALAHDTTATPGLTDRERYLGNTSYVDELIGGQLEQLAITFCDPADAGLTVTDTTTVVYGRVGSAVAPINLGYLAHQVRPVSGGARMRSRFYLNVISPGRFDGAAARAAHRRGDLPGLVRPLPLTVSYARSLLEHCAREMNHLAGFLPELYAEFGRADRSAGAGGVQAAL